MNNLATMEELEKETYPKVINDLAFCAVGLNSFQARLKTEEGIEHCKHGLGRRLFTLRNCLQRIHDISPPTRTRILSDIEKADLTAHLHCFFINNSGAYNNLAWIWYCEKLTDVDKKSLSVFKISLFNDEFQKFVHNDLVAKCDSFSDWYGYLKDFRDPLAHRIPFYVIPYMVSKENLPRYNELSEQWNRESDPFKREEIMDEMDSLGVYTGTITGSFKEGKLMPLHQVVTDGITLLDFIKTYLMAF
jgi:hypothetical protein